jgi:hypothetical protein
LEYSDEQRQESKVWKKVTINGSRPRVSVFIDGDNIGPQWLEVVFRTLDPGWDAYLRRAYGLNLDRHKSVFRQCGIMAFEVFSPATKNKNTADHALIIDAMKELYRGHSDCICIVSADGDFTRLAQAWREEGKTVLGFGPKQTSRALRSCCTEFFELGLGPTSAGLKVQQMAPSVLPAGEEETLLITLMDAFRAVEQSEGHVTVQSLAEAIRQLLPGFAPKDYKAAKMKSLMRRFPCFELTPSKRENGEIYDYEISLTTSALAVAPSPQLVKTRAVEAFPRNLVATPIESENGCFEGKIADEKPDQRELPFTLWGPCTADSITESDVLNDGTGPCL